MFTNSIDVRSGSEGPSYDPYGYTEVTFDGRNGRIRIHAGLVEWCEWNGIRVEGDAAFRFFNDVTGYDYNEIESFYYERKAHMIRQHLRKCGGYADGASGFPGESLTICSKCQQILDCDFDESAVI